MQLQAVIVPPPDAITGALEVAHGLFPAAPEVEEPKAGFLGRFRKPSPAPVVAVPSLLPTPGDAVFVRVGRFGNVTLTDTRSLAKDLREAAVTWPAPVLRVAEVSVGEALPLTVTARIVGEIDDLIGIFRNVVDLAKGHGFFLDRRSFRNEFPVGTVEVPEGASVPESLPGTVVPVEGAPWQATRLTLTRMTRVGSGTTFEEVASISLGSTTEDVPSATRRA